MSASQSQKLAGLRKFQVEGSESQFVRKEKKLTEVLLHNS